MSEQFLDGANVVIILQQMCGKRMPQSVATNVFDNPGFLRSASDRFLQTRFTKMMPADFIRARVAAEFSGRKNVLPFPFFSGVQIFLIKREWHFDSAESGSQVVVVQYQNAEVRVLQVESYSTDEGYSNWYKVKVLNYGCDSQNSSSCGKNWERNGSFGWMDGADEGWMNAKYITLD